MTLAGLAIITMAICIIKLFQLKGVLPGGKIKSRLTVLLSLLVFFFLGYMLSPFFQYIENIEISTFLVFAVFFFGAVFVLIVVSTLKKVLVLSGIIKE